VLRLIAFLLAVSLLSATAGAEVKRVALVVGNSAYVNAGSLANPKNDASDISAALKKRGFQVLEGFDLNKVGFDRKIRDFAAALVDAEAGVFFYAGHGLQVAGKNYLVPVDAELTTAESLEFEMVQLDLVQRIMEGKTATNILFLDACRNNPLARNLARAMGTRSAEIGRGLAPMESGVGTLISFSTQPQNVALDGTGRNSPFAGSLAPHIAQSSESLSDLLIEVRNDVRKETSNKQVPWEHSALTGRFYFSETQTPLVTEAERTWPWVKDTANLTVLENFIKQYGDTPFGELARKRLAEVNKDQQIAATETGTKADSQRSLVANPPRYGCDPRLMRVVGGKTARSQDWPSYAVLRINSRKERRLSYFCGGSAIHKDWVLTGAHCFSIVNNDLTEKDGSGVLEVVIGADDLDTVRDENVYEVERIISHADYKDTNITGRDIGLVRLKRPYTGPLARLSLEAQTDPQAPPGALVAVAGFGLVHELAVTHFSRASGEEIFAGSQRLQEVFLPTVPNATCKVAYPRAKIDEEQICTGFDQGGRDACQGDAGGPVVAYDGRGCAYQVGIISWGAGCGGAKEFGVNTRTSYHGGWLERQVGSLLKVSTSELQQPGTVPQEVVWRARTQLEDTLADAIGRVRVRLQGGNRVRVGSDLVFTLSSDIAGRAIVLDVNSAGEVVQILPNRFAASSLRSAAPGGTLTVPGEGFGFKSLSVSEPVGRGLLIALIVPDSFPVEGVISDKGRFARDLLPVEDPANYLAALVREVSKDIARRSGSSASKGEWALGITDYEVFK
jgi:secreted trypsin-like serine protease